jgi:hypothetical protein
MGLNRGLALTDAQISDLRVVVALLPSDQLRGQFSEMLSAALRNRDAVGEGRCGVGPAAWAVL